MILNVVMESIVFFLLSGHDHCRSPLGRNNKRSPFSAPYADYKKAEHRRGIFCIILFLLIPHSERSFRRGHMPGSATCSQQTGFYVPGSVTVATASGHPEEVRTSFYLPGAAAAAATASPVKVFFKRSEPVFSCLERPLLPLPHPPRFFFFKRSEPVFTCRARPLLPLPHR